MVRAGVIDHPIKWKESGFFEIINPRQRNSILDYNFLLSQLKINSVEQLQAVQ
jgi:hypothetical protein